MSGIGEATTPTPRSRVRHALAFAAVCALLLAAAMVASAGAAKVRTLGKTRHTPPPDCPTDTASRPCEAIGSVTGFQLVADGQKNPFQADRDGKIVAYALALSRPNKDQRNFFGTLFKNSEFGTHPSARIAVLKRVARHKYKLLRQSRAVTLDSAMGHTEIFTLDNPLGIRKGRLVGLTVPTWAPNFASPLNRRANEWRASRTKDNCAPKSGSSSDVKEFARKSRPQQKIGSTRIYACDYRGARLLYWAYYVPS
jgi:hypothetical protein